MNIIFFIFLILSQSVSALNEFCQYSDLIDYDTHQYVVKCVDDYELHVRGHVIDMRKIITLDIGLWLKNPTLNAPRDFFEKIDCVCNAMRIDKISDDGEEACALWKLRIESFNSVELSGTHWIKLLENVIMNIDIRSTSDPHREFIIHDGIDLRLMKVWKIAQALQPAEEQIKAEQCARIDSILGKCGL